MKTLFLVVLLTVTTLLSGCGGESREVMYDNGQIKEKGKVYEDKNGNFVKKGEWKHWFEDGQLKRKGEYDGGKRTGLQTEWRSNGNKRSEMIFLKDKLHGVYKTWHSDGSASAEGKYKNDKKNGLWQEWYTKGELKLKVEYMEGNPVGSLDEWHSNGKKKREETYNKAGKLHGKRFVWYSSGRKKSEEIFENGKFFGEANAYYDRENSPLARTYIYLKPGFIDSHTSYDFYGNKLSSAKDGNGTRTDYSEGKNFDKKDVKDRRYTCYNCSEKMERSIIDGVIKSYPRYYSYDGLLRFKANSSSDGGNSLYDPD